MQQSDFDEFVRLLDATYALHSKALTAEARGLFFAALYDVSLADVSKSFSAHLRDPQRGQFPPKPADLIAQVQGRAANDGRPGAEEAWAIALSAQDEAATVVLTEDISAAFGVARPVLDAGDEVGARMAFKETYQRLVGEARAEGVAPKWFPSLGTDVQRRSAALQDAASRGLLPRQHVAGLLPPPEPTEAELTDAGRAGLARVRAALDEIDSRKKKAAEARETDRIASLGAVLAKKQAIAGQVAKYAEQGAITR